MTSRSRGGVQSSHVFLLSLLLTAHGRLCPRHCTCGVSSYRCANNTVIVEKMAEELRVYCTGKNITCSDLPQIYYQVTSVQIYNCPSSTLTCLRDRNSLNEPLIQEISLYNLFEILKSEYLRGLINLKTLRINQDKDAFMSIDVINTLKYIKHLHISGGNLQFYSHKLNHTSLLGLYLEYIDVTHFDAAFFDGLPNLKVLEIKNTNLKNIGAGLFKGLTSLEHLLLFRNELKEIEEDAFSSTKLRSLDIDDNQLQSLPNRLLSPLKTLQQIHIRCPDDYFIRQIEFKLGSHAFAELPELQSVKITHCYIRTIPETLFEGSTALTSVSIDENSKNYLHLKLFRNLFPVQHQNMLTIAPGGLFANLTSLKTLTLTYNNIGRLPKEIFFGLRAMESLDLSLNSITELHKTIFEDFTYLKTLDLSGNNIKALYDGTFSNLGNLDSLDLSDNAIEELTVNVFAGLNKLRYLNLNYNKIMMIEVQRNMFDLYTIFRFLPQLLRLNMRHNRLYQLCRDDCVNSDIPLIQKIDLAGNNFAEVLPFQRYFSKRNVVIDLSDNNISEVNFNHLPVYADGELQSNSTIILINNPIYCDCVNYDLFLQVKSDEFPGEPQFILGYRTTCAGPPKLKGEYVIDLSPSDLVCELNKDCPKNCSCVFRPATLELIMDCHETPKSTVNLIGFSYYIRGYRQHDHDVTNTLILHHQPECLKDLNINALNLSNTRLDNITFGPNDSLKVLDVSHNNLSTIPDAFLQTNITLYLSNNPLKCDCSLVKELKDYRVADFELVTCVGGEKLSQINVERLCAWNTYLMGFICMGIMVGIFVIKFTISVQRDFKRNWRYITRRLFGRESEFPIDLMRRIDAAKQFDLFVSFAHQDSQFVSDNLLPRLENEFGQKVCVHHRDWIAGELITDQIIQSVENARRTVIILTEHFITSEWAYFEFRTAHNMSIREGRPRVIMILLKEDIVNDARLDTDIRSYITINTYLVWGDPDFWRKLKQVLPKRRRQ